MKDGTFDLGEASEMDTTNKYDVVLSHSVFHYFRDLQYAREVVEKMICKANKKIAVFDINDVSKKEKYLQVRTKGLSPKEYEERYKDLDHMFYGKKWFEDIALEFNLDIQVYDQEYTKYLNSELRFNVIMTKK